MTTIKKHYILLTTITIVGMILLNGCTQNTEQQPLTEKEGTTNTISISNFSFNPPQLTIDVGTTVTWINEDSVPHTVTAKESFDSKNLSKGQSFNYTFNEPGSFDYTCTIHPSMEGTIIVN